MHTKNMTRLKNTFINNCKKTKVYRCWVGDIFWKTLLKKLSNSELKKVACPLQANKEKLLKL